MIRLVTGAVFLCLGSVGMGAEQWVISEPWVRQKVPGSEVAGVFLTIENKGTKDLEIESVSSPVAKTVEVHETVMENGMMSMRPVKRLVVQPSKKAELKPGSLHIMLIGVEKSLKPGEMVPIEVKFKQASKNARIVAPVRPF